MPAPDLAVVVLDVADPQSLDRSASSVLEAGLRPVFVRPSTSPDSDLVAAVRHEVGPDAVLLLCAGELITAQLARELSRRDIEGVAVVPRADATVPNPFAPVGSRLLPVSGGATWSAALLAADLGGAVDALHLEGAAGPINEQALGWLRRTVHLRERERGATSPTRSDQLFDAACLAWAGEYDAALVRALELSLTLGSVDQVRAIAARVAAVTALAIRRPEEASKALNAWWSVAPSPHVQRWARLAAAVVPSYTSALAPILSDAAEVNIYAALDDGPWMDRALQAAYRVVAEDSERAARRALASAEKSDRPISSEDTIAIWRYWRGTALPLTDLVAAWPRVALPGLRVFLERGWQIEAPAVWGEFAYAFAEVVGPTDQLLRNAAELAGQLTLESVIAWETMRHKHRLRANSPLLQRGADGGLPPVDAVFSAAVGVQAGLGRVAADVLAAASTRLSVGDLRRAVELVMSAAPSAVPILLKAAADGPLGAEATSGAIDGLGVQSPAVRRG